MRTADGRGDMLCYMGPPRDLREGLVQNFFGTDIAKSYAVLLNKPSADRMDDIFSAAMAESGISVPISIRVALSWTITEMMVEV